MCKTAPAPRPGIHFCAEATCTLMSPRSPRGHPCFSFTEGAPGLGNILLSSWPHDQIAELTVWLKILRGSLPVCFPEAPSSHNHRKFNLHRQMAQKNTLAWAAFQVYGMEIPQGICKAFLHPAHAAPSVCISLCWGERVHAGRDFCGFTENILEEKAEILGQAFRGASASRGFGHNLPRVKPW